MAENRMRYRGVLGKQNSKAAGLPSIKPSISGNMAPTSFDAMVSKEWVEINKL